MAIELRDGRSLLAGRWFPLAVLGIQNLVVYWGHYFRGVGIPWDFSMSYYAMVAFWTSAVRQGVFPQWIPFQQMGYPFALQAQSGLNYLPLWFFPAVNIPYTLYVAIVVQCLHVLAGSVGMFVLARHLQASTAYALLAAVTFQFFGGFYSNAEHVDIVRAFAFTPWLLWAFTLDDDVRERLPKRALLIPPLLWLFLTGAYPGNVIACGVMIPLFVAFQAARALTSGSTLRRLTIVGGKLAALGVLGCGLAAPHLVPIWLFRDQFFRGEALAVPRIGLWIEHVPGLFLSNRTLPGEISMTSTYVTLPALVLACLTPVAALRRWWPWVALTTIAAVMAAGDHTVVGRLSKETVPALALSRFPSSDYRIFVGIAVILLATVGLRALVEQMLSVPSVAVRMIFCLIWLCAGVVRVHPTLGPEAMQAFGVGAATLAACVVLWRNRRGLTIAGLAVVLALVSIDAARVLPTIQGWYQPNFDEYYSRQGWPPYARDRGRRLVSSRIVRGLPARRPARTTPAGLVRWAGYLNGNYYTTDLTPNVLRGTANVFANPVYQGYMLREWAPILLPSTPGGGDAAVHVSDADLTARLSGNAGDTTAVVQMHYGVNDITYQVSLAEPRTLVENEMFFPGWQARLTSASADSITAVAANGVFRAWHLPAGNYAMTARFEFPYLLAMWLISGASLVAWLGLWIITWRVNRATPSR